MLVKLPTDDRKSLQMGIVISLTPNIKPDTELALNPCENTGMYK